MKSTLARRRFLELAASFVALPVASRMAEAQMFPSRPVTLIVPWAAGGTTDISLRALASATEKHLGQPVIIENRAGAAGTLGPAQMAANARPDGYVISQIAISVYRLPFISKTSFDPAKDFTYIIGIAGYTFGVVVRNDAPWRTYPEFLTFAKANPGRVSYGTPGANTSLHITMEQIARLHGIKWTHVPFRGTSESSTALLGGHLDAVADATGWAQLVNEGRLRLLVTWGAGRSRNWPDVPTLKEVGIDMLSNSPYGLAGPKGMDPHVVSTLHDAFRKGLNEPSFTQSMLNLDQEPFYLNSDDYHAYAVREIVDAKRLVEELGLK